MEGTIPRPDVAEKLKERFIALAADADDAEEPVVQLAMKLEDAMMLPFVIFADSSGEFVEGYSGAVSPPYLLKTLDRLTGADAS